MSTPTKITALPQTFGPSLQTAGDSKTITYLPISEQIRRSFQKTNRMPMITGCILGAFVPVAVYLTSHSEAMKGHNSLWGAIQAQPFLALLILGGLLFSATSVSRWGYQAFGHSWVKAIGFVILVEGTLILSPIQWLALAALAYLVVINGLVTGTTLALDRKKHFSLRNKGGRPPKSATQKPIVVTPQLTLLDTQNQPATTSENEASKTSKPRTTSKKKSHLNRTESPIPAPEEATSPEIPGLNSETSLSEMLTNTEK